MAGESVNPAAILALISNLYEQLTTLQQRIEELEAQIAGPAPAEDKKKS